MKTNNKIYYLLILSILVSCETKKSNSKKERTKPNIIYILADDLGYGDVGAYGQTKIETPNIDALAREGMLFTQHYSGAPVCAPSRAVLMTGKHLGHSFIRGNDEWRERGNVWSYKAVIKDSTLEGQRPFPSGTPTIASMLKKSGYKTGVIGKWGLGAPGSKSTPNKVGFDYFFGYNCQRQAHTYNPVHLYENEIRYHLKNDTIAPSTGIGKNENPMALKTYEKYNQPVYSSTIAFEKLMEFVKENKATPFFLYWASPIPHLPLQAPKNWVDYYVKKFGDEKPFFFREEKKGSYFPVRYPHATYAGMISYLDENIGKLIKYLKEESLYENTLIVFTSDNGPTYNLGGADSPWFDSAQPFRSEYGRGKGFLYEGGIRVPMIVSWPAKIKAGTKTDHISAFYDVMPTISEVVNEDSPNTDGISFYKILVEEEGQKNHQYLYWEYPQYSGQVAVRMGKWKIIWKDIKKGNKSIELYNLQNDLTEKTNVAADYPEIIKKLFDIIKKEHSTPNIKRFEMKALEEAYNTN